MTKKMFVGLLALLLLQGCLDKEIIIPLPFEGEKIVIEGFISPNKVVELEVYKTSSPIGTLDIEGLFVSDATVLLFENDTLIETLEHVEEGLYESVSGFKPTIGKSYHIEVSAPNLPKIVSKAEIIPDNVPAFSSRYIDSIFVDLNSVKGELEVSFQDNKNIENYYEVRAIGLYGGENIPFAYFPENFSVGYPSCEIYDALHGGGLKDVCFENDEITVLFKTDTRIYNDNISNLRIDKCKINLRTTSESYFSYQQFIHISDNNRDNPFVEPAEHFTNIEGGYGVFAAYNEKNITINL